MTKTKINAAILKACDPMRPRWMRELGVDLERMTAYSLAFPYSEVFNRLRQNPANKDTCFVEASR